MRYAACDRKIDLWLVTAVRTLSMVVFSLSKALHAGLQALRASVPANPLQRLMLEGCVSQRWHSALTGSDSALRPRLPANCLCAIDIVRNSTLDLLVHLHSSKASCNAMVHVRTTEPHLAAVGMPQRHRRPYQKCRGRCCHHRSRGTASNSVMLIAASACSTLPHNVVLAGSESTCYCIDKTHSCSISAHPCALRSSHSEPQSTLVRLMAHGRAPRRARRGARLCAPHVRRAASPRPPGCRSACAGAA